jgi:ribonuclease-3
MDSSLISLFNKKELLELALTHRSWVNEHSNVRGTNERLEFLGDAVLEFVISREIYARFPNEEEGFLTALRANLVNTTNLSLIANSLDIGKSLYLSKGEEEGGGRNNPSILADTVEAIIGALFMDGGIDSAEKFISENIFSQIEEKAKKPLKDPKSTLQEIVQSKGFMAPLYKVVAETGPDHDKNFKIEVHVDGKPIGEGSGKNKSEAAQNAAKDALTKFPF